MMNNFPSHPVQTKPSPPLRTWLLASFFLNAFLACIFFVIYFNTEPNPRKIKADPSLALFIFFAPVILRITYSYTRQFLESNRNRIRNISGLDLIEDYDTFLIKIVKLMLMLALLQVVMQTAFQEVLK